MPLKQHNSHLALSTITRKFDRQSLSIPERGSLVQHCSRESIVSLLYKTIDLIQVCLIQPLKGDMLLVYCSRLHLQSLLSCLVGLPAMVIRPTLRSLGLDSPLL